MGVDAVKAYLAQHGLLEGYREFETSSATVALAAQAVGCEEGRIAKTLSLNTRQGPILIVAMGTSKIDNRKFKDYFGEKASFIKPDDLENLVGYPMGGVCPFAIPSSVRIYLDASLREFDPVYPAAGAPYNAVRLSLAELEQLTGGIWIDVCKY